MQTVLTFHENGTCEGVSDNTLELIAQSIGELKHRRASHVWPVNPVKRFFFRVLRSLFGERGRIAQWCRNWYGPWEVRFIDPLNPRRPGAVVFSHCSRRVCIAWEIEQLNKRFVQSALMDGDAFISIPKQFN